MICGRNVLFLVMAGSGIAMSNAQNLTVAETEFLEMSGEDFEVTGKQKSAKTSGKAAKGSAKMSKGKAAKGSAKTSGKAGKGSAKMSAKTSGKAATKKTGGTKGSMKTAKAGKPKGKGAGKTGAPKGKGAGKAGKAKKPEGGGGYAGYGGGEEGGYEYGYGYMEKPMPPPPTAAPTVCVPSPCKDRLAQVIAEDDTFTSDKCYFDKDAPPTQGCWFPVTNGGPDKVTFDPDAGGLGELIDEYCECHLAYEIGCVSKIPFGAIGEDNGNFDFARFTSGDGSTPSQYGKYCVFAGIWNGDIKYADNCGLDDELMKCGCLWVDAAEDKVDDCFGVELGSYNADGPVTLPAP